MMIGARTAAWSGKALPYREVDYIESLSSDSYFQTEIYPSADFSYHGKFFIDLLKNSNAQILIGCGWGSNGSSFIPAVHSWHPATAATTEIQSRFVWGSKAIISGIGFGGNEFEIIVTTDSDGLHERIIANGTEELTADFPTFLPSQSVVMPIRFLACGADTLYVNSLGSRIIGRHTMHSGSVDAEFIPVDDGNGNGCLYESVSRTLLRPAAGSFSVFRTT